MVAELVALAVGLVVVVAVSLQRERARLDALTDLPAPDAAGRDMPTEPLTVTELLDAHRLIESVFSERTR